MSEQWPFADQRGNPLARARHVALMYRTALGLVNPTTVAELDKLIEGYGERWVRERIFLYADDDQLTSGQVAEYLGVSVGAVRQYRLRGRLPAVETIDGWRYKARDVQGFRTLASGRPRTIVDDMPA